jgi:hypothetical protein
MQQKFKQERIGDKENILTSLNLKIFEEYYTWHGQ